MKKRGRKQQRGSILLGLFITVLVLGIAGGAYTYFQQAKVAEPVSLDIVGLDQYLVFSETTADASQNLEEVTYYVNTTPEIENGAGSLVVDNSAGNYYYLAAELVSSSNMVIYRSGIIPPGYRTDNPTIPVETGDGIHALVISVIDPDTLAVVATQTKEIVVTTK